jgi:hypothetical protein
MLVITCCGKKVCFTPRTARHKWMGLWTICKLRGVCIRVYFPFLGLWTICKSRSMCLYSPLSGIWTICKSNICIDSVVQKVRRTLVFSSCLSYQCQICWYLLSFFLWVRCQRRRLASIGWPGDLPFLAAVKCNSNVRLSMVIFLLWCLVTNRMDVKCLVTLL